MRMIRATVRLQLHAGFTFDDARRQVDYYDALGVSHYYLSPILASCRGSTHGYDGVDPTRIDPELGGETGLEALVEALHARGMGIIADIVPNHLAIGAENPWWQDVLARGQASEYAHCFDIDWEQPGAGGKLLLPFLGDRYLRVLESGELKLVWEADEGRFAIAYHEHRFPIDPTHSVDILSTPAAASADDADEGNPIIAAAIAYHDPATLAGRERLHALLERQAYRLAHWRMANDALNWRRFFDITELAGVRVEDESVFDLSHRCILALVERGWIDGLRIDHVDGLADPRDYCLRLRSRLDAIARQSGAPIHRPIYVEKILGGNETLHDDWGIDGTTGYEFLDRVSGIQHDPKGREPLTHLWCEVSGRTRDFGAEVRAARREMLHGPLTTEFERCIGSLRALAVRDPATREFSAPAICRVLEALAVAYPVYRSYADRDGRPVADADDFASALAAARRELSAADADWLTTLDDWLGGQAPGEFADTECALRLQAIARFQQLTSPLAAKAVEDTAGYRSAVLLSRNDVGCEGAHFAYPPERLHDDNRERLRHFPLGMLTTATHDHKRGEDVRARLAAMSELTSVLTPRLRSWASDPRLFDGDRQPSGGDRLMLLQLILAAWPVNLDSEDRHGLNAYAERLVAWQRKAMREAKLRSHWLAPDSAYEQAGEDTVRCALSGSEVTRELAAAAALLDIPGAINGLAQATLRLCSPGTPDLYQGTEFWDQSLVDPDNRREVDISSRRDALLAEEAPATAWRHWRDGAAKQALIQRLLDLRREYPQLFRDGSYRALEASGERAEHVFAFARQTPSVTLVIVVPRLPIGLLTDSTDMRLDWRDTDIDLGGLALDGEGRAILTQQPVAMLAPLVLEKHLTDFPCGAWVWTNELN